MAIFYSNGNSSVPIGRVEDYNNTNPARIISLYRTSNNFEPVQVAQNKENTFASAIYGNSGYSLSHPNVESPILAQNIDVII